MSQTSIIVRKKLFEQVAAHLERDILEGRHKPGDSLPSERELQVRFGVGRPAIREALISLRRSGLIEFSNGAAARVALPTAQDIMSGLTPAVQQWLATRDGQHQLQGVRLFVEVGLVRNAALNATEEDLRRLEAALRANEKAIGNRAAFIRTDVAFHFVLAETMHNSAFVALHQAMSTWLARQRQVALSEPGEDRRGYEAHARIFRAIKARDPDAAEEAMRTHLMNGWSSFWKWFERDDPAEDAS